MNFKVEKDRLKLINITKVNSATLNHYVAEVEFDESWNGLTKKAILIKNDDTLGEEVAVINNRIYLNIDNAGKYNIGFVGYKIENDVKDFQISTNLISFLVHTGAGEIEASEHELPTLTEWEIYIKQIQDLCDGVVIKNITETIDELNHNFSIEYTNGDTFNFTIKDGEKGEKGQDGYTPIKDVDYFDGKDGKDGKDGEKGADGEKGQDATINGVNTLNVVGGKNISIEQTDDTLKINNDYEFDDSTLQANIETLTEALEETDRKLVALDNTKQDLLIAGANITINDDNVISAKAGLNISVVDILPQTGSTDTIYLVADEKAEDDNIYLEYIWVNNKWELIGSTKVDLTDYVDKALLSQTLEDYAKTEYVDEKAKTLNDRIDDIDDKLGIINTQLAELTDVEVE